MTSIIFITGIQGCGKSALARIIAQGLAQQGKTALELIEHGKQDPDEQPHQVLAMRDLCVPQTKELKCYDFLIAEYNRPLPKDFPLGKHDLLITLEKGK